MLDREGYVRIADFGLCKENMDAFTHTSTFCGTKHAMAPELLTDSSYTRAVDWWALGVLMFEMLVGDSLIKGDNEEEIYSCILNDEIVYPSSISEESTIFMDLLLEREPEVRLGWGEEDAEEVKAEEFFNQFNFEALLAKKIPAPFVPKLKNLEDVSYFDEKFTQAIPIFSPAKAQPTVGKIDQEEFAEFDYLTNWTS